MLGVVSSVLDAVLLLKTADSVDDEDGLASAVVPAVAGRLLDNVLPLETAKVEEGAVVAEDGAAEGVEGRLFAAGPSPILTQPDLAVIAAGQLTFSQLTLQGLLAHRICAE